MPVTVDFDRAQIEWVQFRPDPLAPGQILIDGFGRMLSAEGQQIPTVVNTWEGIDPDVRATITAALHLLMFSIVAAKLEVPKGEGLIVEHGIVRPPKEGETPVWVKP